MKKAEFRIHFKQKRRELSPSEIENRSEGICDAIFTKFQLEGKIISLFLPIEKHKEINTYHILEKGLSIGTQIALPKIIPNTHTLKHYLYESHSKLEVNSMGIPEPVKGKLIKTESLDYVFIPLLAVDKTGHRIGYGKGYYDRFLKKCSPNCLFIGLHLFDDFVDIEDIDTHDVQLNYCVTPYRIVKFDK